jgi:hypothetical protein
MYVWMRVDIDKRQARDVCDIRKTMDVLTEPKASQGQSNEWSMRRREGRAKNQANPRLFTTMRMEMKV